MQGPTQALRLVCLRRTGTGLPGRSCVQEKAFSRSMDSTYDIDANKLDAERLDDLVSEEARSSSPTGRITTA